ncbi:MAG: hypothetical protein GY786_15490 [Proteobacteria bacterium]|nr:hypothetical protein [Pseudomonadota bacterium]
MKIDKDLFGYLAYNNSYDGYVIEKFLAHFPRWQASFYRTSNRVETPTYNLQGCRKNEFKI